MQTVALRKWVVRSEPELTREAYALIESGGAECCGCEECFNFAAARHLVYTPELLELLETLGIDPLLEAEVVAPRDTSPEGMAAKAAYVVQAVARRLEGLGVGWGDVTTTSLYTVAPVEGILGGAVLDAMGPAARQGLRWYHARPPIDELDFEMDARGVRRELWV